MLIRNLIIYSNHHPIYPPFSSKKAILTVRKHSLDNLIKSANITIFFAMSNIFLITRIIEILYSMFPSSIKGGKLLCLVKVAIPIYMSV